MSKAKITKQQKEEAIQIAIRGGSPVQFLEKCGSTNPSNLWYYIKKKLKEEDPDAYNMLPKQCSPVEKQETSQADAVKIPDDDEIFQTTAIRNKNLGEFYYDHDHNCIDWRNGLGDEVSMGIDGWKLMIEKLPDILQRLGVEL